MLYRYGWIQPVEMGLGHYPTMTLAPHAIENPFAQTSILYRGDTTRRFYRTHPVFDSVRYYSGYVANTPDEQSSLFVNMPGNGRIHSFVTLLRPEQYCGALMEGGIQSTTSRRLGDFLNQCQPSRVCLRRSLAADSPVVYTSIDEASRITRTGDFAAASICDVIIQSSATTTA